MFSVIPEGEEREELLIDLESRINGNLILAKSLTRSDPCPVSFTCLVLFSIVLTAELTGDAEGCLGNNII